MNTQALIEKLLQYITLCGEDAYLFEKVKASDVLDQLLALNGLQLMLDNFEDALRDIYQTVKSTGVEE